MFQHNIVPNTNCTKTSSKFNSSGLDAGNKKKTKQGFEIKEIKANSPGLSGKIKGITIRSHLQFCHS